MRKRRAGVYFRRYLAFSLLILAIPMLILGFLLYGSLVLREFDRSVNASDQSLGVLADNLSALFDSYDNIALQMRLSGQFSRTVQRNELDMRRSVSELATYTIANHNIRELVVWVEGFDYLLSSNSSYTQDIFINGVYKFENWNLQALRSDMTDGRDGLSPVENVMASNVPLRLARYRKTIQSAPSRRVVAYFLIDESVLRDRMREHLVGQGDGINVLLLDRSDGLIVSAFGTDYLTDSAFMSKIQSIAGDSNARTSVNTSVNINGSKYLARVGEKTVRGSVIVSLIPERAIMIEPMR